MVGFPHENWSVLNTSEPNYVASVTDQSSNTIVATGASTARSLANRFADCVNVLDFGAVGNDTHDDTTHINTAITYARTNGINKIIFPALTYRITGPLNFTGFGSNNNFLVSLVVEGWGAVIDAQFVGGTAVIDMMGSRWMHFKGLTVRGNPSFIPRFGLQLGRTGNGVASDQHEFDGLRFVGKFGTAAIYNFASEANNWRNIYIHNQQTTNSYCLIADAVNDWSVTSTFVTLTASTDTTQSMNENRFHSPNWVNESTNTSIIWTAATKKLSIDTGYMASMNYSSAITIDVSLSGSNPLFMLDVDCHFETTPNLTNIFLITGTSSGKRILGLRYRDQYCFASDSIFKLDTGVTSIIIPNLDIEVGAWWSGTPTLFDTPSAYTCSGIVKLPYASSWADPASFVGTVITGSGGGEAFASTNYGAVDNAVIIGGSIDNTVIGDTTPVDGSFDTFNANAVYVGTNSLASTALNINRPAGNYAPINFRTAFNMRWQLAANANAEAGSNAGTDFVLKRFNDAGTLIDTPLAVTRSSGDVAVANNLAVGTGAATISSGSGEPSSTQPAGSLYLRTDGEAGTHVYVSQGTGSWTAIGTV